MGKSLEDMKFVITGRIRTADKEKTMNIIDSVLRNNIPSIILDHVDVGNMSCYYPNGNEK